MNGQIWYVLLFISSFLGLCQVQRLNILGFFFPPRSAYLPSTPCIESCLLFLSIIPSVSPGIIPIQNWLEEKLPFVSHFPPPVGASLLVATLVTAETAKSEIPGSQNILLCSALLYCFLPKFFLLFLWLLGKCTPSNISAHICFYVPISRVKTDFISPASLFKRTWMTPFTFTVSK